MIKKIIKKTIGESNIRLVKSSFLSKKEKELLKKRKHFYKQFLNPGDTYFDVGANYGNRIEPLINENIKIIAVEPQLNCVKYLKKKYKNKITVIPCGLGEKEGTQTMYISSTDVLTSFSSDWIDAVKESGRFSRFKWDQQQEVKINTLDNLIAEHGTPQFLKIDVEGFEHEVLKGLSQPVKTISFEYTVPERNSSVQDCIDRIIEIGKDNTVLFNYSKGESMEWVSDKWLPVKEMKEETKHERFISSGFGDIYAKTAITE